MTLNETRNESMNLILTSCEEIKNHLKRREKEDYDWEYDVLEHISEIGIEANSWIETPKTQNKTEQ